jgi:peptidyl-prolyl cis-trans isomerase SurA
MRISPTTLRTAAILAVGVCLPGALALAQPAARAAAAVSRAAPANSNAFKIVAVVNGDVVSQGDVDNRRRLFAMSTGMPASNDVLDRLTPQVTHQLIDERLRLQEIQRRKIVVSDKDIADAISEVESRNRMPPGTLRKRLSANGVEMRTLIDQLRVQIGWSRVLRQVLAGTLEVSDADIAEQERIFKSEIGKPEFHMSEIFVPISDPSHADDAQHFADTIIQQLRAGAPFPIVAAQFSQSQTALQGGDLGWVDANQLDPAVLKVATEMPPGAISNPIKVPGGLQIVTVTAKREIGRDTANILHVRQVFFPFTQRLDPANPTPQQKDQLVKAQHLSASATTCDAMDAAAKTSGSDKPADPGEIRLETVGSPPLRALLSTLPDVKASQPLVAEDGIAIVMICSRETKNVGLPTKQELQQKVLGERIELASQQLQRELERKAVIDQRS